MLNYHNKSFHVSKYNVSVLFRPSCWKAVHWLTIVKVYFIEIFRLEKFSLYRGCLKCQSIKIAFQQEMSCKLKSIRWKILLRFKNGKCVHKVWWDTRLDCTYKMIGRTVSCHGKTKPSIYVVFCYFMENFPIYTNTSVLFLLKRKGLDSHKSVHGCLRAELRT